MNDTNTIAPASAPKAAKPAKAKPAAWDRNIGSETFGIRLTLAKSVALMDGNRNAEAVRAACRAVGIASPDSTIDTITADFRATVRALRAAGRMPGMGEAKAKKGN